MTGRSSSSWAALSRTHIGRSLPLQCDDRRRIWSSQERKLDRSCQYLDAECGHEGADDASGGSRFGEVIGPGPAGIAVGGDADLDSVVDREPAEILAVVGLGELAPVDRVAEVERELERIDDHRRAEPGGRQRRRGPVQNRSEPATETLQPELGSFRPVDGLDRDDDLRTPVDDRRPVRRASPVQLPDL